jgi:hypothetical protein
MGAVVRKSRRVLAKGVKSASGAPRFSRYRQFVAQPDRGRGKARFTPPLNCELLFACRRLLFPLLVYGC